MTLTFGEIHYITNGCQQYTRILRLDIPFVCYKYHKMKWNRGLKITNDFVSQDGVRLSNYI